MWWKCKCKNGQRWMKNGKDTRLWSWVLSWDHSWSVTCSRCYWLNWPGLEPGPQTTAVCKQRRWRGNCGYVYISRSKSWPMNSSDSQNGSSQLCLFPDYTAAGVSYHSGIKLVVKIGTTHTFLESRSVYKCHIVLVWDVSRLLSHSLRITLLTFKLVVRITQKVGCSRHVW